MGLKELSLSRIFEPKHREIPYFTHPEFLDLACLEQLVRQLPPQVRNLGLYDQIYVSCEAAKGYFDLLSHGQIRRLPDTWFKNYRTQDNRPIPHPLSDLKEIRGSSLVVDIQIDNGELASRLPHRGKWTIAPVALIGDAPVNLNPEITYFPLIRLSAGLSCRFRYHQITKSPDWSRNNPALQENLSEYNISDYVIRQTVSGLEIYKTR